MGVLRLSNNRGLSMNFQIKLLPFYCVALLWFSIATIFVGLMIVGLASCAESNRIGTSTLKIDPFYNHDRSPDVQLSNQDSLSALTIIRSAPEVVTESDGRLITISPAPGTCILETDFQRFYILRDCRVEGRKLDIESRRKLHRIFSGSTNYFELPEG